MKILKIYAAALLLLSCLNPLAQAKTIILADIDDTLKISHVSSKWDALKRAYRTDLQFSGMQELLMLLGTHIQDSEFYYVSNAPAALMTNSHARFLADNKFPAGKLRMREGTFDGNHKLATITNIFQTERPDTAILLGDNSELDGLVYDQLAKDFPGIRMAQFIRIAYTSGADHIYYPLFPKQIGFVSPVEVALALNASGEMPSVPTAEFVSQQEKKIVQAEDVAWGPGYFPDWLDCRDFRLDKSAYSEALKSYNAKIRARCGKQPARIFEYEAIDF